MSARDSFLPGRALEGFLRSCDSQVAGLQRRVSRWPGGAVAGYIATPTSFVPGTNLTRTWHDVLTIEVGRGSWFVVADVVIVTTYVPPGDYPRFWASIRLNSSDDASAEDRGVAAGGVPTSNLTSYSEFITAAESATITLQVSSTTGRPGLPSSTYYPVIQRAALIARPN